MDGLTLQRAGWRMTTEHSASSYGIPVLVAPDRGAIGDADMVAVNEDGTLASDPVSDPLGATGKLYTGAELRAELESIET